MAVMGRQSITMSIMKILMLRSLASKSVKSLLKLKLASFQHLGYIFVDWLNTFRFFGFELILLFPFEINIMFFTAQISRYWERKGLHTSCWSMEHDEQENGQWWYSQSLVLHKLFMECSG